MSYLIDHPLCKEPAHLDSGWSIWFPKIVTDDLDHLQKKNVSSCEHLCFVVLTIWNMISRQLLPFTKSASIAAPIHSRCSNLSSSLSSSLHESALFWRKFLLSFSCSKRQKHNCPNLLSKSDIFCSTWVNLVTIERKYCLGYFHFLFSWLRAF